MTKASDQSSYTFRKAQNNSSNLVDSHKIKLKKDEKSKSAMSFHKGSAEKSQVTVTDKFSEKKPTQDQQVANLNMFDIALS